MFDCKVIDTVKGSVLKEMPALPTYAYKKRHLEIGNLPSDPSLSSLSCLGLLPTVILQTFGALKFRWRAIAERSV